MKYPRAPWLLLLPLSMLAAGCGGDADAPAPEGENAAQSEQTSAQPAPPKVMGPAETVEYVLHGVGEKKPQVLWETLPQSYQNDINGMVAKSVETVDPEIWNKGFATAQKAIGVLKDKKDFIINYPMLKMMGPKTEDLEKAWTPIIDILETVVNSDLSSTEKMKNFDGGKFLSATGAKLMEQVPALMALSPQNVGFADTMNDLKSAKATVVTESDNAATVKVEMGGKSEDLELVKVDDTWVPKEVADKWDEKQKDTNEQIEMASAAFANKEEILKQLDKVNEALDSLAAAKTQEEFNVAVGNVMANLQQAAPIPLGPGGPAGPGGPPQPEGASSQPDEKKDQ